MVPPPFRTDDWLLLHHTGPGRCFGRGDVLTRDGTLVADGLGLPLDSVEASGEFATSNRTFQIAAGTIQAGTVVAQRITVAGVRTSFRYLST